MKRLMIILMLLIVLTPLVGCGPSKADAEQEAIVTFTRQALAIEAQRDGLKYPSPYGEWLFKKNAPELESKMRWLECPQTLQPVILRLTPLKLTELYCP